MEWRVCWWAKLLIQTNAMCIKWNNIKATQRNKLVNCYFSKCLACTRARAWHTQCIVVTWWHYHPTQWRSTHFSIVFGSIYKVTVPQLKIDRQTKQQKPNQIKTKKKRKKLCHITANTKRTKTAKCFSTGSWFGCQLEKPAKFTAKPLLASSFIVTRSPIA